MAKQRLPLALLIANPLWCRLIHFITLATLNAVNLVIGKVYSLERPYWSLTEWEPVNGTREIIVHFFVCFAFLLVSDLDFKIYKRGVSYILMHTFSHTVWNARVLELTHTNDTSFESKAWWICARAHKMQMFTGGETGLNRLQRLERVLYVYINV